MAAGETVGTIIGDQCQYGAKSTLPENLGQPIRKSTGWMSNCPEILRALSQQCKGRYGECSRPGGGQHAICQGRQTRHAQVYSEELCMTIIKALIKQLEQNGEYTHGCLGLQAAVEETSEQDAEIGRAHV